MILWCGVASSCVVLRCVALKYGVFLLRPVRSDLISTLCDISKLIVFFCDVVSCMLCCSVCVALFRFVLFVVHCLSLLWVVLVCFVSFAFSIIYVVSVLARCICIRVGLRCLVSLCVVWFRVVWLRSASFGCLLLV